MVMFMLLFYIKPYPDETLSSFLYRTAKENLMDNLSWILNNYAKYSAEDIHINEVNWLRGKKLSKIADFLSITKEAAKSLTFCFALDNLELGFNNIAKNPWFSYSRIRCCTQCLKDNLYYRMSWSSSHSLICVKHKVLLMDHCRKCNKQLDLKDIIEDKCQKCKLQISDQCGKVVKSQQLEKYQKIIDNIFSEKEFSYSHPWIKNKKDFLSVLEFLACWSARLVNPTHLFLKEFSVDYDGKILERNHLKNAKTISQATCIYFFAFQIIDEWPTRFHEFLQFAEIENKPLYSYFLKNIIPGLNGTNLWSISKELTNYLTHFKMSLPKETKYITSDEIKYFNKKFNAAILHSSELKQENFEYQGILFTFINTTEIKTFFKRFENSLTKEELREIWDTSAKSTFSILQSKIIDNVISFTSGSVSNWVIPLESINVLETLLKSISQPLVEPSITLNHAFEWIGPENSHLLLSGIANKKLRFQWMGENLGKCRVLKKEVYQCMKEQILNKVKKHGRISLKDVTFILGIKKSDLNYWLNTRCFGTFQNFEQDFIRWEQYLYFAENYITSLELTMILNLSMKQILKKQSLGQFPVVSGPKLNDGKRILYDRKKIFISFCKE